MIGSENTLVIEEGDYQIPEIYPLPIDDQWLDFGTGNSENVDALYNEAKNSIFLGPRLDDKVVLACLIHELAHWSTFQALSAEEKASLSQKGPLEAPITECIAYYTELSYITNIAIVKYGSVAELYRWFMTDDQCHAILSQYNLCQRNLRIAKRRFAASRK